MGCMPASGTKTRDEFMDVRRRMNKLAESDYRMSQLVAKMNALTATGIKAAVTKDKMTLGEYKAGYAIISEQADHLVKRTAKIAEEFDAHSQKNVNVSMDPSKLAGFAFKVAQSFMDPTSMAGGGGMLGAALLVWKAVKAATKPKDPVENPPKNKADTTGTV